MSPDSPARAVVITGANGFIGSALVRHFSGRGWRVLALCRAARDQRPVSDVTFREFSLPDGIRDEDFEGGEVLIHCAYVQHSRRCPDSDAVNTRGTERLLALSRTHGYAKFVFLSSLSAHDGAESHYGRHKRELEKIFDPRRDLIVRPGLTLGNGGLLHPRHHHTWDGLPDRHGSVSCGPADDHSGCCVGRSLDAATPDRHRGYRSSRARPQRLRGQQESERPRDRSDLDLLGE